MRLDRFIEFRACAAFNERDGISRFVPVWGDDVLPVIGRVCMNHTMIDLTDSHLQAGDEVMAMGMKAGLDAKVLIDIINASSGRNSATQDKFPRAILPRTFDFGFTTGLSYKDVRLCVEEAEALGVPMVVGGAVREMLAITKARFGAGSDFTFVAKLLEEWAGVEIKG